MGDSRLVYSTEKGRICPECGRPASACVCRGKTPATRAAGNRTGHLPNDGIVRIQREVKGRKGKPVTVVFGVPLEGDPLKRFAGELKRRCGTGGTVKEGIIVIQGDHRDTLLEEIRSRGFTAKLAGG